MSLAMDTLSHATSRFEDGSILMHDRSPEELSVLGYARDIGGRVVWDCAVTSTRTLTAEEAEQARPLTDFMDSEGHVELPEDAETFRHAA